MQYESTRENRENCKKLERLIQRWGGQLIRLTGEQFYYIERTPGVSAAPFIADYAVHYEKRQIFCVTPIWYHLIHEMGHVFASPSMKASEYDFLGWEFLLARQLKGVDAWLRSNADYGVSPDADLGGLSKSEVAELLADRVEDGKRQGIIRRGRPVSIRVVQGRLQLTDPLGLLFQQDFSDDSLESGFPGRNLGLHNWRAAKEHFRCRLSHAQRRRNGSNRG